MPNRINLIADILSNFGFGILTLSLAYININLSKIDLGELDEIKLKKKYNKRISFILVFVVLSFLFSISLYCLY